MVTTMTVRTNIGFVDEVRLNQFEESSFEVHHAGRTSTESAKHPRQVPSSLENDNSKCCEVAKDFSVRFMSAASQHQMGKEA